MNFIDLVNLSDYEIQRTLRQIDINELAVAIMGTERIASQIKELKLKFMRNMSRRAIVVLEKEIIRLKEEKLPLTYEEAQNIIAEKGEKIQDFEKQMDNLSDEEIQKILKKLETPELAKVIKIMLHRHKNKIYRNMSKKAVEELETEINNIKFPYENYEEMKNAEIKFVKILAKVSSFHTTE